MARSNRVERLLARLFLATAAAVLTFVVLELGARLWLRYLAPPATFLHYASFRQLATHPELRPRFTPHRHLGYVPTPGYRRGADRHNHLGFRGDDIALDKPAGVVRVVCLGGSTVYSVGVDDFRRSYPFLLETRLREAGIAAEVVNAGVPGYRALETLINFETRVLDLVPDLIVVYLAINDVYGRLVWPPETHRAALRGTSERAVPRWLPSIWEHSTLLRVPLVRTGRVRPHGSLGRFLGVDDSSPHIQELIRQHRAGTYPEGFFRSVPASEMLARNPPVYFRRNLESLDAVAAAHGVEVRYLTFAHSRRFRDSELVAPEFGVAIDEHNEIVRRVAGGARLFDFARAMPDERRYYTDGYHFTAAGNETRARLIADFLLDSALARTASPEEPDRIER